MARVAGHANLIGSANVGDRATVRGYTTLWSSSGAVIGGDAVLDGDCVNGDAATNGFHFGWKWGGLSTTTIASKTAPRGLFVGYEFAGSEAVLARDLHGTTHGVLRGNPVRESQWKGRRGVLRLDGASHVLLERNVADVAETTVACRVRWDGGAPDPAHRQRGPVAGIGAGVGLRAGDLADPQPFRGFGFAGAFVVGSGVDHRRSVGLAQHG